MAPTPLGTRILGSSGLRVSELCLGTMTFGTDWGWGAEESECRKIYETFREVGGTFFDTAGIYTGGSSESILGRLVAAERDAVVLGTKYTLPTDAEDANSGGSHRKCLRRSVEASLRRLGTDHVDVLWVHAWDRCTPADETLRALDDLVRAGTVLAIGVSNTPAWVVARSQAIAELRGWTTFCGIQVEYSLVERSAERELLPMARELGLAAAAWSPLAGGALAGAAAGRRSAQPKPPSPRVSRAGEAVRETAAQLGVAPPQVALAWVRHRGLIPVVGARTLAHLRDNLGAVDVRLEATHLERLDAATGISPGYPHAFLQSRTALQRPSAEG